MARKEAKKRIKLNIKLLVAVIIGAIFVICFAYNIISLFINPTDTFMIENGKIYSSEETVGYIIREEKIFQGENYKNGISQIKTEGQRVAKGDPIFRYYTNNEENLIKKIADLDIQILVALEQTTSIYSSDIASIDRQIEQELKRITKSNEIKNISEAKKSINSSLIKKAKLTGDLSPSGSYLKELISRRSEYERELNSGSEYVEATVSGFVSYKVDGLEEVLTPNGIEDLTEEYLNNLKLRTGEMIGTSDKSGKIVNNYYNYIATVVSSEEVENLEVGNTLKIILSTGDEVNSKVKLISKQESGKTLIIFQINSCVEKLVNYRKISLEIVWWSANGLRVPNSSIIEKEGINYIIRKRIGYTDEIPVKVLKVAENYSIIDNYTGLELKELGYSTEEIKNVKNISLYDEILLKP